MLSIWATGLLLGRLVGTAGQGSQRLGCRRGKLLFAPRKDSGMKPILWLVVLMLLPEVPLLAQDLPDGVSRSVDTFTGDTVWETKYGRLDDPHGCKRSSLAIVWRLIRGP